MNTYTRGNILTVIDAQLSLAELYHYLSAKFPMDRLFWNQLETEEVQQLEKLELALKLVQPTCEPEVTQALNTDAYLEAIDEIESSIENGLLNSSRSAAFGLAHKIEKVLGKLHFRQSHTQAVPGGISSIFLSLNACESEHSDRIADYWRGITTLDE